MTLAEILKGYESHPLVMRESVRTIHRKWIKDTRRPQEGIYWWVPRRIAATADTPGSISWGLAEFFDKSYLDLQAGDGNLHIDRWAEVLELLALRYRRDANAM